MWMRRIVRDEAGQAASESAILVAALTAGASALGWPLFLLLHEAWQRHEGAVRAVVDLPLP